jgi:cardiolipin synthase
MNLDSVSIRCNLEANIVTTNAASVEDLAKHFLVDLAQSKALTYDLWQQRPAKQKIFEKVLWPFHAFL